MNFQEWLEGKFTNWERAQAGRQSYYNFARFLDVNHTALAQWVNGVSIPASDDLAKLASKLGTEVYPLLGLNPPTGYLQDPGGPLSQLPSALRQRLVNAIQDTAQQITTQHLDPESTDGKLLAVKVFEKWGFHISG